MKYTTINLWSLSLFLSKVFKKKKRASLEYRELRYIYNTLRGGCDDVEVCHLHEHGTVDIPACRSPAGAKAETAAKGSDSWPA